MQVYFLRHGLADRSAWDGDDFQRPLTPEGRDRMKRTARTLERLDLGIDHVVSSPLARARQTAEIVAKRLDLGVEQDERLAGGFGPRELQDILEPMPSDARMMLVGHEPTFSDTIGAIVGGAHVVCKKGSLTRVDLFSVRPPRGQLVWVIPPRVLVLDG